MKPLLRAVRGPIALAALVSVGVNLLMLVSPIYMMQVFDRVLTSGHVETLFVLTLLAVGALAVLGMFDALRQTIMARAGDWLERWLGDGLVEAALKHGGDTMAGLRQVGQLRYFLASQAVFALLDTPWIAVFAAVLWWMHPWLGLTAILGAWLLLAVALLSEILNRKLLVDVSALQGKNQAALAAALRSGDAVRAMGMADRLKTRWQTASHAALTLQRRAAERSARLTGFTKFVRLAIQVAVLGCGAVLVLRGELTAGGMIAASILLGRCLAPAEQAIGAWRGFVLARSAWRSLSAMQDMDTGPDPIALAGPMGEVRVENVDYAPRPGDDPILQGLSFVVRPGECVAVVGPSGSGKTTLCRLLVGALAPSVGDVRIDERPVRGWNAEQIGRSIGYLPQGVQLLPGSLKDNIARFEETADERIVDAATRAGADEMIRRLPDGYETDMGDGAAPLSMGQLQRVGLARAVFGRPRVLVLDEPNANLDVDGERALAKAILDSRSDGTAVIVVTHRASLLEVADKVLVLRDGRVASFGPRQDMIRPISMPDRPAAPSAAKEPPAGQEKQPAEGSERIHPLFPTRGPFVHG